MEFREIVRRENLKGLLFHEMWSSESGARPWEERTDLFIPPKRENPKAV